MNRRVDFHPAFLVEFEELAPPVQDELAMVELLKVAGRS